MTTQYYADAVKLLFQALKHVKDGSASADDVQRWISITTSAINALQDNLITAINRPIKQRYQTSMTHLTFILNKLQDSLKTGGDVRASTSSNPIPQSSIHERVKWTEVQSAFDRRIKTGVISNLGHLDITSFMDEALILFRINILMALMKHNALKVYAELAAVFVIQKSDSEVSEVKYFSTESASIYKSTDLSEWFEENVRQPIQREMEEFEERDSGWTLQEILSLTVNMNTLNPLKGSSFIPLPADIASRKACINVRNNDDECFRWAVLSALHPQKHHAERNSSYLPFKNELKFDNITFPVMPQQIGKFEKLNTVSINLYILQMYDGKYKVTPCYLTSTYRERHVNLLLIQDFYVDEKDEEEVAKKGTNESNTPLPKFHYVWIKNLSALVRKQLTKHHGKCHICDRCLHYFYTVDQLTNHKLDCTQLNKCRIRLPTEKEKYLKFNNFNRKEKVPYVIYADFECILKPVNQNNKDVHRAFQLHQAYSIGYYLKCSFDNLRSGYKCYRQTDEKTENGEKISTPAEWFVQNLKLLADELLQLYENPVPMSLSEADKQNFKNAKICHICGNEFFGKNVKRVRDHCHFTGKYRGAAHEGCNLNYQNSRFIPVIFHNLSGYDSHFIIKEIATATNFEGRVSLIAENKEKYISFTKHITGSDINFRFIDSFRFMASSLDKLASYLQNIEIAQQVFENEDRFSTNQINLLRRKGVFPYDYVSSFEKLKESQLPPKEGFYSSLNDCDIRSEDYSHAQEVWRVFNIRTLGEYSDLYLKTDVLLLADVFEHFRSTCIDAYGLDPAHYYTTPGLTWDAMLKHTGVVLELLTDVDMLMFIERGIRGGISQCCNRYAKANNEFMGNDYNVNEEIKYLMYFDVNNLYGWAMTQYLPHGGFKWVDNVDIHDFSNIPDDSPVGFILEVDLEYPEAIHDDHKDLPLCPEHLSPPGCNQKKLLTTLFKKERYVIHYRALKQALRHGLILKKIYRALSFNQSPWLKSYVDLNTEKRKNAKNEFEKLFFKLLINAVYGKTMENERKRVDVKLIHGWSGRYGAEAMIAKPNFHSRSIFAENLVAVQLARTEIAIRKPIYVGLCVLDLSKICVYDFHYGYMKERIGKKCKVLYTDTDSLIYEIRGVNIYEIMKADIHKFDTSDYPENNQFSIPLKNKKVIGIMKDECNGNIMTEFIGLRSKMYSVLIQNKSPIKKAKGVKAIVVKNKITFDDYRNCLFNESTIRRLQCNIRSKEHTVRTEKSEKIALSAHDDKRYLIPNETDTLPWGHYSILIQDLLLEEEEEEEWGLTICGEGEQPIPRPESRVGETITMGGDLQKDETPRAGTSRSIVEQEYGEPNYKRPKVTSGE